MKNIQGKIALVTGASRGLGYQTAKLLASEGIHVIGLARTVGALENLSDEISDSGGSSTMVPIDLTSDTALETLSQEIFKRWGRLDYLIHAACIPAPMSPVSSINLEDLEKLFFSNTRALVKLIQITDPFLKQSNNGMAVFVDDLQHGKFLAAYSCSKSASREVVNSYQKETQRMGIKVETFVPRPMPTALRARFFPGEQKSYLSQCSTEAQKLVSIITS